MREGGRLGAIAVALLCAAWASPGRAQDDTTPRSRRHVTWRDDETEAPQRIDTLVSLNGNASVELQLYAGTMTVSTWDRNEARVVAEVSGGALDFDASSSHLDLSQRPDYWEGRGRSMRGAARYQVTLPAGARLSLNAVSGSITATGTRGSTEISTVSGPISVSHTGRNLTLESVSGRIDVADAGGDVRVNSVSGTITAAGVPGVLEAETVSGRLLVTGAQGERVRTESVSGSIDFQGTLSPSGRYSFETHSGHVTLRVPATTNADIAAETFSGSVTNDVPGAVRRPESDPDDERTNYHYVLGRGGAHVSVSTFSGRVTITTQGNQ